MKIRVYQSDDCKEIIELFYNTVHSINVKDYTDAQLDVWATKTIDRIAWDKSLSEHYTVVTEITGVIVGFGDIDNTGYLDRLFIHKDYQGKGIATAITIELEAYGFKKNLNLILTHASITAKPFFEKCGYHVLKKQVVERSGQRLTNFVMQKQLVK
ncbi:GNAT family N-acetyltransferase [Clostridium tagluense]|uniref:GNAT family N-acetyltransferase n=1 Tax=Clostridium tagluense TaxID=360422 RepID=UPI001C6F0FC6|nr:GNAT family N-acetyltransferase [Clostridium tagluense]MBW9159747.1 GNAT family N-acetyltransferase [Clostridium tagluense]WLC68307.1 GNAT family N-acetyltransferase [Clostridium tagluense]